MRRWKLALLLIATAPLGCSEPVTPNKVTPTNSAPNETAANETASNETAANEKLPIQTPPTKTEEPMFDGTWLVESAELGGAAMPPEFADTTSMTLAGDQYTVLVAGTSDRGTVRRDDSQSPKTMDITGVEGPNKGKTFLAIYEWRGDKLQVCYDLSGAARPTEFATKPGTQQFLVTYKRK